MLVGTVSLFFTPCASTMPAESDITAPTHPADVETCYRGTDDDDELRFQSGHRHRVLRRQDGGENFYENSVDERVNIRSPCFVGNHQQQRLVTGNCRSKKRLSPISYTHEGFQLFTMPPEATNMAIRSGTWPNVSAAPTPNAESADCGTERGHFHDVTISEINSPIIAVNKVTDFLRLKCSSAIGANTSSAAPDWSQDSHGVIIDRNDHHQKQMDYGVLV